MDCVEKNKKHLSLKKHNEIIGISQKTFYFWRKLESGKCQYTENTSCKKKHPTKLSKEEEFKILQLLKDPAYAHYPLSSLIWKARHEGIVYASKPVWVRIRDTYQVVRKSPKKKIKYYHNPLKASYSNQYLHADITYFKIQTKTYYIYIIKDNYSKYIKSWTISDAISSETRIETFKKALSDIDMSKGGPKVTFITDQGKENKNDKVRMYLKKLKNVDIKYAKLDIPYSNSMIERFNYDLKYMYLYRENITCLKDLNHLVEIAVNEHNNVKRMDTLNGQTPMEVYFNMPEKQDWLKEQWRKSRRVRSAKVANIVCCLPK